MRLPNGYGSVYKLSGNRRRPWIARKTIGWDENGKQQYYTVGYFEKREDALAALAEYNRNPIGHARDITLGELYGKWSVRRYPRLKPSTQKTYKAAWNHLQIIKKMPAKDIKLSHLQDVVDEVRYDKGLSHSTCHKVKVLAGILCKEAMADDIISQNYAELIELPPKGKARKDFFSEVEIKKIDKLAQENEWAKAIMIMVYTGFRIGEMLDLTKFSVDIETWLITGGGKTDAGTDRVVPIHDGIKDYVTHWYNTAGEYLINEDGRQFNPKRFREQFFRPTLMLAGVRQLNPHAARHTFATMLARTKSNSKAVQNLMGHAEYSTTQNIYTHTEIEDLRKAIASIS